MEKAEIINIYFVYSFFSAKKNSLQIGKERELMNWLVILKS